MLKFDKFFTEIGLEALYCGIKEMYTQRTAVVHAIGWCTYSISNFIFLKYTSKLFVP